MGSVTKFQDGTDKADCDGGKKLEYVVMFGVINLTQKKTKVQRQRQYNKKCKNYLVFIHRSFPGNRFTFDCNIGLSG